MCLGIPGEVLEIVDAERRIAKVDVAGVRRNVNYALLEEEGIAEGDWILIHVGFAMSKIDEQEAALTLAALEMMGQAYQEELRAVAESRID